MAHGLALLPANLDGGRRRQKDPSSKYIDQVIVIGLLSTHHISHDDHLEVDRNLSKKMTARVGVRPLVVVVVAIFNCKRTH